MGASLRDRGRAGKRRRRDPAAPAERAPFGYNSPHFVRLAREFRA